MKTTAQQIADALNGKPSSNGNFQAFCPSHDDGTPSLSIKQDHDKVLFKCFAGCSQNEIMDSLSDLGLWSKSTRNKKSALEQRDNLKTYINKVKVASKELITYHLKDSYDYFDARGNLKYTILKKEGFTKDGKRKKKFEVVTPDGNYGLGETKKILFNLRALCLAIANGETVYIVEGEKDVTNATKLGLVATCNPFGATKWEQEFSEIFAGANVVIIPDKDEPGLKHFQTVFQSLSKVDTNAVGVIDLPFGKDISDFIDLGGTKEHLESLIVEASESFAPIKIEEKSNEEPVINSGEQAEEPQQNQEEQPKKIFERIGALDNLKPVDWVIRNYIESNSLSVVFGAPGSGKSFIALSMACSIATGADWYDNRIEKKGFVIYIAGEGHNGLKKRLRAWEITNGLMLKDYPFYVSKKSVQLMDEQFALSILDEINELKSIHGCDPSMVIIDTVARNFGVGDENSTVDMNSFVNNLDRYIREPFSCHVMLVHHSGHTEGRARGSSVLRGAIDSEFIVSCSDQKIVSLKNTKMKDADTPEEMDFRFMPVGLGFYDSFDGNEVMSVVLDVPKDTGSIILKHGVRLIDALREINNGLSQRELSEVFFGNKKFQKRVTDIFAELEKNKMCSRDSDGKVVLTREGLDVLSLNGKTAVANHDAKNNLTKTPHIYAD